MRSHTFRRFAFRLLFAFALLFLFGAPGGPLSASDPGTGNWPMWGGTADRNMVSDMTGLPTSWDVTTGENVAWVAELGSQSYGNPVVADGVVLVGTNNERLLDPAQGGDRGVLMAFDEETGAFLWQQTHRKLESGRANDWPFQGVASSPLIHEGRVLYTTNRGVVMSLDVEGFRDGENDGPITDEELTGLEDADVIWAFDMMEEVGAYPHNLSNSSPVISGNPDVRQYVERARRESRQRPRLPWPRRSLQSTGEMANWPGRTTRSRTEFSTANGPHRPWPISGASHRSSRLRVMAGCAATWP